MMKLVCVLIIVFGLSFGVISQKDRQWEILISALSLEQQDGLFFSGAAKGQVLNAIGIAAPVSAQNYIRLIARRVDWSTTANDAFNGESSTQKGFNIGLGFEHRWLPGDKLEIGVGADASYQRTDFTGVFYSQSEPNEIAIDHTKNLYGIAPFLSINFRINKWLTARLETGVNMGIAHVINHSGAYITPVDVYFDATLRPISVLGLAFKI